VAVYIASVIRMVIAITLEMTAVVLVDCTAMTVSTEATGLAALEALVATDDVKNMMTKRTAIMFLASI
jgi:hypothetical protein